MKSSKFLLTAAIATVLVSCSFSTGTSPQQAGENAIESALGEQADLVFVDADCEAPADDAVGTPFTCTALTDTGEAVTFSGVIDPDDSIFVAPSNVVYASDMSEVEEEAAAVVGAAVGVEVSAEDVECPDETTVLDNDVMMCEVVDSTSGDRSAITATFTDFVLREGFQGREYLVDESFAPMQTPGSAAEDLVEGVLADQLGMTLSDASCALPSDVAIGTEFDCMAVNADGTSVTFRGVLESESKVFVAPSNVIFGAEMAAVEQEAAAVLSPEVGVEIDPADVNCPDETTVLDNDAMRCEITDVATGDRYELTATFTNFVLREGFDDRFYLLGDQPL